MQEFRVPGTDIDPDPDAECVLCHAQDRLIEGDGDVVCRPCLGFLGHVARNPRLASHRMREYLEEKHADVVELGRNVIDELEWSWKARWPGVES